MAKTAMRNMLLVSCQGLVWSWSGFVIQYQPLEAPGRGLQTLPVLMQVGSYHT
jgi:hypothetical protein